MANYWITVLTQEIILNKDFNESEIISLLNERNNGLIHSEYQKVYSKIPEEIKRYENVINFSNYCRADCTFCDYRKSNNSVIRYKLNREEIISRAISFGEQGINSVLLHSGYDSYYNTDRIAYIIYSLKKNTNLKIGLSFGLRDIHEYIKWKIAGADSYYLNFITSNPELYKSTNSFGTFDERILHIKELKKIGYSVGSGSIFGIENQTTNDLAEDIKLIKILDVKHIHFCDVSDFRKSDFKNANLRKRLIEITQIIEPLKNVGIYNFSENILKSIS